PPLFSLRPPRSPLPDGSPASRHPYDTIGPTGHGMRSWSHRRLPSGVNVVGFERVGGSTSSRATRYDLSTLARTEGWPMIRCRSTAVLGTVAIVLLGLTGCSGKLRLSPKVMCEAHGGTYNESAKQCTYTAQTRSARQICEGHNGYWDD